MANEDLQLTGDPHAIAKVAKLKADLGNTTHAATVEMHSGLSYSGFVASNYFTESTSPGKPKRAGGYIVLNTEDGRVRLDIVDIKSWSLKPWP